MKSTSATTSPVDDSDDIFGPPRTYPTGYNPPKSRLSMISPKYRQKEEQRKALKISFNKLSKIVDRDFCLNRWVRIRNIKRRLEEESVVAYPRYDNENYLNLKSDVFKKVVSDSPFYNAADEVFEPDFDSKMAEEMNEVNAKTIEALDSLVDSSLTTSDLSQERLSETEKCDSTKKSYDNIEDCDVQEVLSQFYIAPVPRMLTAFDDEEPPTKRLKPDSSTNEDTTVKEKNICEKPVSEFSVNSFLNNNVTSSETRLKYLSAQNESESNSYSCGHASMFNDLQNSVYHNLIASLET